VEEKEKPKINLLICIKREKSDLGCMYLVIELMKPLVYNSDGWILE